MIMASLLYFIGKFACGVAIGTVLLFIYIRWLFSRKNKNEVKIKGDGNKVKINTMGGKTNIEINGKKIEL